MARLSPAQFFVIESLCELDRLPELLDEFAPAEAVWIMRDYHDTGGSAMRSFRDFFAPGKAAGEGQGIRCLARARDERRNAGTAATDS